MAGIQSSLSSLVVSTNAQNAGAFLGDDVAATVQSIVLRAQEAVQLANLAIAKINNPADPASIALTTCVSTYLT